MSRQALVLDIPGDYQFIIDNVILSADSLLYNENVDSLLMSSFVIFLMGGKTEMFIWDLVDDVPDFYDKDIDGDDPIVELADSIGDVNAASVDGVRTHFFVVDPVSQKLGKQLLVRALALGFWQYLRETVFNNDYEIDVNVNNPELNWVNHLTDDSFEIFLKDDFDLDWFVKNMTDSCWRYDDAERVECMDDLVE